MEPDDAQPEEGIALVSVTCFLVVIVSSWWNLILGMLCWRFLASVFSSYFANNSGGVLDLLVACAQTGLYAAFFVPVLWGSRQKPVGVRAALVVGLRAVPGVLAGLDGAGVDGNGPHRGLAVTLFAGAGINHNLPQGDDHVPLQRSLRDERARRQP